MGQKDWCPPARPGFISPVILVGFTLAAGFLAGRLFFLACGVLSGIDLAIIYLIIAAGRSEKANPPKAAPLGLALLALVAGTAVLVTAVAAPVFNPLLPIGRAALPATALLLAMAGAGITVCYRSSAYQEITGVNGIKLMLLAESSRLNFFRLLLVAAAVFLPIANYAAVEFLINLVLGIAIMQRGVEADRLGWEHPFNLYRGNRLRLLVKKVVRRAAGKVKPGLVVVEGSLADLRVTVVFDPGPGRWEIEQTLENIRLHLARKFSAINRRVRVSQP